MSHPMLILVKFKAFITVEYAKTHSLSSFKGIGRARVKGENAIPLKDFMKINFEQSSLS